ncbi:MAG: hypothetical protein NZX77_10830 [Polyangiaceae bacterium]|nr:hypothetical protein [Polyangiaceae bacterium]
MTRFLIPLLVALLLLSTGCTIGTHSQEELDERFPLARWASLSPRGVEQTRKLLEKEAGRGYRVYSLSFHENHCNAKVQLAGRSGELDRIH